MTSLAEVFVEVKPDTKNFGPDLAKKIRRVDAHKMGVGMSKSLGSGFRVGIGGVARTMFAPIAAAAAAVGGFNLFKGFIEDAQESEKIGRLTAQVIKSTGGAAKISAEQVSDLATALSNKSGIDDELVQTGANLLLTFKNVRNEAGKGNDVFNQATQAALDLSAAGFGSVESTAKMLGKALNDPIRGLTALGRAGVTFTDQQKEQIETLVESGDVLGAQRIIMEEIASQVGGAAEAAADPMDKLKVIVGNLGEWIGGKLLPFVEDAATWLGEHLPGALDTVSGFVSREVMPRLREFGDFFRDEILPRLKDLAEFVGDEVVPRLADLGGWISKNREFFIPFVALLGAAVAGFKAFMFIKTVTAAVAAFNAMLLANPIGLVVAAIAALAAGLVYAYQNSETFRDIVDGVFDFIADAASSFWNDFLKPVFDAFGAALEWIGDTAETLGETWDVAWEGIKDVVESGIRFIVDAFLGFVDTILQGAEQAFGWVKGIGPKLDEAHDEFEDFRRGVNNELSKISDEDIKVNVKTYGNLEFGGAGGRGGAGISMGMGGAGPLPGVTSHASQAMGGALDIKTLGLDADKISDLATDFVGQTKAAVQKQITKAFEAGTMGPAGFPLPRGRYSVGRGPARHGYPAVDFPAAIGTPIYAVRSGVVTAARRLTTSYGIHAILGHAAGWGSLYAHMSKMFVRNGQFVRAGQQIGRVGSTGNSTGPHLHFEARRNGQRVNPRSLISYANGGFINEHIVGLGMSSGRPYQFGEGGRTETVLPGRVAGSDVHFHFHGPVASKQGAQEMVLDAYNQLVRERRIR